MGAQLSGDAKQPKRREARPSPNYCLFLSTVGGNQARLDARAEFKISERSPKGGGEAGRATGCRKHLGENDLPLACLRYLGHLLNVRVLYGA